MQTRPLSDQDWPVIETLFGRNGACGGCWCMLWRIPRGGKYWDQQKGEGNKQAFRRLVENGEVFGPLAFSDGIPVGWCSIGPKGDFPYFSRSRVLAHGSPPGTWCVTCFFIPLRWRGKGIATGLLKAAITLAHTKGASGLEGYPVVPKSAQQAIPAAFAWTGVPRLYQRCGFELVTEISGSRPVYRIAVDGGGP